MNVLQLLSPDGKKQLADRFPQMWGAFEANPPDMIGDYVIGMTGGKYKLVQCNEHGYSIVCPLEQNREVVGMSSMNKDRSLAVSLCGVLWWLWYRNEVVLAQPASDAVVSS